MKEKTQADTEFFRAMLSEADGQTTLLSDDDPSLRTHDGEYADYAVSFSQIQPEAAAALPALLKDGGFAADGLFLSAYAYLLRLLSGQKEVLFFIGSQYQGADAAGVLPNFLRIDETVKGLTFVRDTQARLQEIMAHTSADVSRLVEENHLTPDIAYTCHGADSDRQAKLNNVGILSLHLIPLEGGRLYPSF